MMTRAHHNAGLVVIVVFKLVKRLLFLLVGLGLLKLVHAEIATLFSLVSQLKHHALRARAHSTI